MLISKKGEYLAKGRPIANLFLNQSFDSCSIGERRNPNLSYNALICSKLYDLSVQAITLNAGCFIPTGFRGFAAFAPPLFSVDFVLYAIVSRKYVQTSIIEDNCKDSHSL
jgi:hypothetical protein